MATNKRLEVSELDFNQIKNNLKTFLKTQDTFQDYNFEGSALNTLLDVMAYVTHYNAVNANIGINETFLETAQFRGSVVGHARQLGYTPKSVRGPTAIVDITVNGATDGVLITLEKNHPFRAVIDGTTYTFVTTQPHESTNGIFNSIEIKQGTPTSTSYIYDVNTSEKFIIPEINVDTSTLEVTVAGETYTLASNVINVTSSSRVFFLNETFNGRYEIVFGDGIVGTQPVDGSEIVISYLVSDGPEANGASIFSANSNNPIGGIGNISVTTINRATGGSEKESIQTIKYRAPLSFTSQNRAVTPDDYRSIILNNFDNASSISVWGGEDNDPPQYGRVYISIIPQTGELLTDFEKETITETILKPKAVLSVTPEYIDPEYTYVRLQVFYRYNEADTSLTTSQLNNVVRTAISNYNDTNLRKFDGVLRYSQLGQAIDSSDQAIINSSNRVWLKKRFVPILNLSARYELNFSTPLYLCGSTESIILECTTFTYNGEQCVLDDYLDVTGQRLVRIIRSTTVNQRVLLNNAGFIDAANGKIVLTNFSPSAFEGSYIEIVVRPNSFDVPPKRNNVSVIDMNDVEISGTADQLVSGVSAGGTNYTLIPRA